MFALRNQFDNTSLRKRVIAWIQTRPARIYKIIERMLAGGGRAGGGEGDECKQTWRTEQWNVSAELKQLKMAKRKVELKEKKNMKT